MKVLFVSTSSSSKGGGELYLVFIGKALVKRGHQVGLACSRHESMDALCESFEAFGKVIRYPYRNTYRKKINVLESLLPQPREKAILNTWKNFQPDVLHLNKQCLEDGLPLLRLAEKSGIPHTCTIHITQSPSELKAKLGLLRDGLSRKSLRQYQGSLITIAKPRLEALQNFLPSQLNRILCIENGVRLFPLEDKLNTRERLLQREKLPQNALVAIAVGRIEAQKNPLRFLNWMVQLKQKIPQLHAIWVGSGRLEPCLREAIQQAEAEDWIHLAGWQSDPHPFFAGADLYVHSADFEGLPFSLLEAMSWALPTLISQNLAKELQFGPSQGCLPAGEQLESNLIAALGSSTDRIELGERARQTIESRFSMEVIAREYEKLYQKVIADA